MEHAFKSEMIKKKSFCRHNKTFAKSFSLTLFCEKTKWLSFQLQTFMVEQVIKVDFCYQSNTQKTFNQLNFKSMKNICNNFCVTWNLNLETSMEIFPRNLVLCLYLCVYVCIIFPSLIFCLIWNHFSIFVTLVTLYRLIVILHFKINYRLSGSKQFWKICCITIYNNVIFPIFTIIFWIDKKSLSFIKRL